MLSPLPSSKVGLVQPCLVHIDQDLLLLDQLQEFDDCPLSKYPVSIRVQEDRPVGNPSIPQAELVLHNLSDFSQRGVQVRLLRNVLTNHFG